MTFIPMCNALVQAFTESRERYLPSYRIARNNSSIEVRTPNPAFAIGVDERKISIHSHPVA